jgi:hypothetical protein
MDMEGDVSSLFKVLTSYFSRKTKDVTELRFETEY